MANRPFHSIADAEPAAPPPPMGSNSGIIDLALLLDAAAINAALQQQYADKLTRRDTLTAATARFMALTVDGITDDAMQGKATDFAKQLRDEVKTVDAIRTKVKQPVLDASRVIDGFFKREITDPLEAAATKIIARATDYAREKAARERRQREDEARRLQAEADARAAAAQQQQQEQQQDDPAAIERAIAAEQAALDAQARTQVSNAEASRVYSDLGTTSSLRTRRTWELDDLMTLVRAVATGKAPSNLLTINKPIADAMARDKAQADLPGLRFIDSTSLGLR